jgi:hypothetical protein
MNGHVPLVLDTQTSSVMLSLFVSTCNKSETCPVFKYFSSHFLYTN